MLIYQLISIIERENVILYYKELEDVQQVMLKEYISTSLRELYEQTKYAGMPFQDRLNEVTAHLNSYDSHLYSMDAWVSDGPSSDNYDWHIEEINIDGFLSYEQELNLEVK